MSQDISGCIINHVHIVHSTDLLSFLFCKLLT